MLEVKNLTKSYGSFRALDGFHLSVKKGELFGLAGPNGAGKTTAIKIMTGLLRADSGQVFIHGTDMLRDAFTLKDKIGYVPDFFGVYDNLKALEYMEFYASAYGLIGKETTEHCLELMELVGLLEKRDVFVDDLSRGMQQRLCLARAMIHKPELLILDEPASGLDPHSRFELKKILRELCTNGTTIIISSHILAELSEMCSSIGIIQKGQMKLQGSMEEILSAVNISNPLVIRVMDGEEKALAFLKAHPFVKTLAIDGKEFQITFTGDIQMERELLENMVREKISVLSFGRKRDNLESVFIELTKKGRREEE